MNANSNHSGLGNQSRLGERPTLGKQGDCGEVARREGCTVHVIADSDTRWKWGALLASQLAPDGVVPVVHGHLLPGRATPSDQQLDDVGAKTESLRREGIGELLHELAVDGGDVVVLACVGGTIQSLLHALAQAWQNRSDRPVVVTGYVGVVYERMVDGLLLRAGADVVLANSPGDAAKFRAVYEAIDVDPKTIVRTALPFLGGAQYDPSAVGRDRPFTVTFVVQPSVPARREERRYALEQAAEHARRWPDRRVIVKLRGRPGEQTTHVERHHYATLLPDAEIPANLEFVYGQMSDVLDRTDLCLTVSSTAALESMHRSIPTGILTDFGVREGLGNHVFLPSAAFTSWSAVHSGAIPGLNRQWASDNGVGDDDPYAQLRPRIAELIADRSVLKPIRPWFTLVDHPAYLPQLLERNGLDDHGLPLATYRNAHGAGIGRRALRASARRVYRVSVRKIEPRIRRWAQL
jgi:hypothetical protein